MRAAGVVTVHHFRLNSRGRHLKLTKGAKASPDSPYEKKRETTWEKAYEELKLRKYYDQVGKRIFKLKNGLLR